jgi:hypothetical protein
MVDETTTNVIQFRPEASEEYSEATMQEAIRNLAHPDWNKILDFARANQTSRAARFISALGPIGDLNKLVANWRMRVIPPQTNRV